jgi:predicted DNA-binding protein (UPF0251 family)
MLNGLCIDGRHRTRAAKELGITVHCTDVDPTLDEESLIMLCNKNVMSGRDYDNTQKAIQALRLVDEFKMTAVAAARIMKVHKVLVTYAATIKGYGREDILQALMSNKGNKAQLDNMERPSRSLELLAKYVKAEKEKEVVVIDDSERIQWKPNAVIKTELGKAWYYEQIDAIEKLGKAWYGPLIGELANLKFKLEEVLDEPRE